MVPVLTDVTELYALMRAGHELYKAQNRVWHLTHRIGAVSTDAALAVRKLPGIAPSANTSEEMWCFGRTMDVYATQQARATRRIGQREIIYTDGNIGGPPADPIQRAVHLTPDLARKYHAVAAHCMCSQSSVSAQDEAEQ